MRLFCLRVLIRCPVGGERERGVLACVGERMGDGGEGRTGQCSGAFSGTVVGRISLDTGKGTGEGSGRGGCVAIIVLDW